MPCDGVLLAKSLTTRHNASRAPAVATDDATSYFVPPQHAFSGKAKPKVVTVNFVSKKGAMQLSWGSKSGVPLETIYGVTKGIKTEALRRVVEPERAENCFSLLTHDRTIDFEVDNPWLVLLVVRALRLFLGAHYDTLPAPTFFSHLCLRSRGVNRPETPKQTLVWTSSAEKPPVVVGKVPESSPVGRTSGSSISGDSVATSFSDGVGGKSAFDNDGDGECEPEREPEPEHNVRHDNVQDSLDGESSGEHRDAFGGADEEGGGREVVTSPGGIMALFCSSGRSSTDDFNGSLGGGSLENGSIEEAVAGPREKLEYGEQAEEGPPTVSQLLATKGMRKRMTLSKRLSATNAPTGPLKGKRFELMALPMDHSGQQERRERGFTEDQEFMPKRTQGMSISIGAGYELPEEQKKPAGAGSGRGAGRSAVEEDLNHKLQSLRKLQLPQPRLGGFRAGRPARTMAFKHMAFFQGAGGSTVAGSGMGSVADMWGDGVRRIHQTDTVRQENQSLEDVRRRDDARTAMLVTRSGVHKVPRKGSATELF